MPIDLGCATGSDKNMVRPNDANLSDGRKDSSIMRIEELLETLD